jgi:ketosteroid isomerase-like protein
MSPARPLAERFLAHVAEGDLEAARVDVQEGLGYYNRRELGPLFDLFDAEIEWLPPAFAIEGRRRGHAEVRELLDSWLEEWEELRLEVEELHVAGDQVVLVVHQRGRGRASGVEIENRVAFLWRICDRRVCRFEVYPRPAEALSAVGLATPQLPAA